MRPRSPRLETVTRAELETVWDGRLLVTTRRSSSSRLSHLLVRPFTEMRDGRLVSMMRGGSQLRFLRLLVQPLTNWSERLRHLARSTRALLARGDREVDEAPVDPIAEGPDVDASTVENPGLAALVMLLRCYGIGAEFEPGSPPVRDGQHRRHRDAALR